MGSILVTLAGILWGAMGLFVRGLANLSLSTIEICFVRMIVSTVLLALFLSIYNSRLFKIRVKDLWVFIGTGLFSLTFFGFCYFTTIQMTSMSVAAVLLYTSPVFVLILSAIFFKEKITKKKIFCIITALAGCVFVTGILGESSSISALGILFGLGSGFGYCLYSIFSRFAINKGYKAFTITFYSFVFSTLSLFFLVNPVEIAVKICSEKSIDIYLYIIGIAVVTTVLPYGFYTIGLTKIENSTAAVIACIEPIMATVFGLIFYHEKPDIMEITGICLVLFAICMLNVKGKNES